MEAGARDPGLVRRYERDAGPPHFLRLVRKPGVQPLRLADYEEVQGLALRAPMTQPVSELRTPCCSAGGLPKQHKSRQQASASLARSATAPGIVLGRPDRWLQAAAAESCFGAEALQF